MQEVDRLMEMAHTGQQRVEQEQSLIDKSLAALSDPGSSFVVKSKSGSVGRQVIQAAAALDDYKLVLASSGHSMYGNTAEQEVAQDNQQDAETLIEVIQAQEKRIRELETTALEEAKELLRSEAEKKLRKALAVQIREQITADATIEMKQIIVSQMTSQELEVLCFEFLEQKRAQLQQEMQRQWQQKLLELDKMRAEAEDRSKLKQAELSFKKQLNSAQAQHQRELASHVSEEARLKKRLQDAEEEISGLKQSIKLYQRQFQDSPSTKPPASPFSDTRLSEANSKVQALERELAAVIGQNKELQGRLEALQMEYTALGDYICQMEQTREQGIDCSVQSSGIWPMQDVAKSVTGSTVRTAVATKVQETPRKDQPSIDLDLIASLNRKYMQPVESPLPPQKPREDSPITSPVLSVQVIHKDRRRTPQESRTRSSQLFKTAPSPLEHTQNVLNPTPEFVPAAPRRVLKDEPTVPQLRIKQDADAAEVALMLEKENMQQKLFYERPPMRVAHGKDGDLFAKSVAALHDLWDENEISYEHRNCFLDKLDFCDLKQSLLQNRAELRKQTEIRDKVGRVMKLIKWREDHKTELEDPGVLREIIAQCNQVGPVFYRGINYLRLLHAEGAL